jgi:hypothetical protein
LSASDTELSGARVEYISTAAIRVDRQIDKFKRSSCEVSTRHDRVPPRKEVEGFETFNVWL